jgi:hypothetical protein
MTFDPERFAAELRRELVTPTAEPALPAEPVAVDVLALPPPPRWKHTVRRHPETDLIIDVLSEPLL